MRFGHSWKFPYSSKEYRVGGYKSGCPPLLLGSQKFVSGRVERGLCAKKVTGVDVAGGGNPSHEYEGKEQQKKTRRRKQREASGIGVYRPGINSNQSGVFWCGADHGNR